MVIFRDVRGAALRLLVNRKELDFSPGSGAGKTGEKPGEMGGLEVTNPAKPGVNTGVSAFFVDDDWVRFVKNSFWRISSGLALGLGEISEGEEAAEGEGGLGVIVFGGRFEVGGGTLAKLIADGGFFEAPGAELAPASDGHGFDEVALDGVSGLELELQGSEKADEADFGFVGENDGARQQAMSTIGVGTALSTAGISRPLA